VTQFGEQWLQLRTLDSAEPDVAGFDDGLRQSMRRETRAYLSSVLLEDRSVLTLLDADYTFLDERLAVTMASLACTAASCARWRSGRGIRGAASSVRAVC
jgi:hypothetical protein